MKKRSRLIYFLQEIAIVVIGVLIAVSISNYKEKVENENYIEKTLLAIKNVSLRFFISNKAELLEFQLISQLLDIESATDILSDKIKRLGDFANDNVNEGNDEVKIKFAYLLANVIDGEQTLLAFYSSFLQENKSYLKKYK